MDQTNETIGEKIIVPVITIAIVALLLLLYIGSMRGVKTDTITSPIAKADPFQSVTLSARAAMVWDVKNQKVVYAKNADVPLPLASLTKVMTAVAAADLAPDYTIVPIQKEFLEEEGDSGLFVDEKWRLKDLINFSLTASSNDGARAIASVVGAVGTGATNYTSGRQHFISYMNEKAHKNGFSTMRFQNENGLDPDAANGGAYGSARDVTMLFEYALKNYPEVIDATKNSHLNVFSLDNILHTANNTNSIVNIIPGIIASKTGYTDLAGGNLAIVFDADLGRPFIVSVLGSTMENRFTDVAALVAATRTYIEQP